jgi:hypothetical protein
MVCKIVLLSSLTSSSFIHPYSQFFLFDMFPSYSMFYLSYFPFVLSLLFFLFIISNSSWIKLRGDFMYMRRRGTYFNCASSPSDFPLSLFGLSDRPICTKQLGNR